MSNETKTQDKVNCPLCGKCVKISKTGKVSRHKSAFDYSGGSSYARCNFSGNTLDTPLETLRSLVEAGVNGESVTKRELEALNAALPVEEAPAETLQDKVNALPLKSLKVLAAVIPAMYDDESSCYLEDVTVEGMSIHAITGTLPHLSYFIDCENLAESGTGGTGYLLSLRSYKSDSYGQYSVYEVNAAIKARLNAPVEALNAALPVEEAPVEEEARCYHVTRCKFDPRGNPSAWSTDSSYATLEEARARCAELVAELGGAVDPSSLSAHSCETVGDVGIQLVYDTLPARDNTKTYVGAHNGAYLYETSPVEETPLPESPRCSVCGSTAKVTKWGAVYKHYNKLSQQVGYCKGSGKVPAVETPVEPLVKGLPAPAEEEARVIRVTVPQVDALRALGYEVKSCKLRYYPSQVEEMLERLYAERETKTRGARRVYTSLIERVSTPSSHKPVKRSTRSSFSSGDLRIEYASKSALAQVMRLVDAAERGELISKASASALRSSCTPPRALREVEPEEEETGGNALARFFGED